MFNFSKRKNNKVTKLPNVLIKEDSPVNYNTVLDYLTGLSKSEFDKIVKVANIYRNANKEASKVLGVKDEPTISLKEDKPTEEEIDIALDTALEADRIEFLTDDPVVAIDNLVKEHSPSKKLDISVK